MRGVPKRKPLVLCEPAKVPLQTTRFSTQYSVSYHARSQELSAEGRSLKMRLHESTIDIFAYASRIPCRIASTLVLASPNNIAELSR